MIRQITLKWVERNVDKLFMSAFYDMELRVMDAVPEHPYYRVGMKVGWQELKEMAKDGIQVVLMP